MRKQAKKGMTSVNVRKSKSRGIGRKSQPQMKKPIEKAQTEPQVVERNEIVKKKATFMTS